MDLEAHGWEPVSDTMLREMVESEELDWDPLFSFREPPSPLRMRRTRITTAAFSADGVTTGGADHSKWLTHTEHRDGDVVSAVAFRVPWDGELSAAFRDFPKGELTLDTAAGRFRHHAQAKSWSGRGRTVTEVHAVVPWEPHIFKKIGECLVRLLEVERLVRQVHGSKDEDRRAGLGTIVEHLKSDATYSLDEDTSILLDRLVMYRNAVCHAIVGHDEIGVRVRYHPNEQGSKKLERVKATRISVEQEPAFVRQPPDPDTVEIDERFIADVNLNIDRLGNKLFGCLLAHGEREHE